MNIDAHFENLAQKNHDGTLTVKEAPFGYYRLRTGKHAGRVIIKHGARIDDKEICHFAKFLTWVRVEDIGEILCEQVGVAFIASKLPIDYSQATWYGDSGDGPHHYEW